MRRLVLCLAYALALSGCARGLGNAGADSDPSPTPETTPAEPRCPTGEDGAVVGTVADPALPEISGLVASRQNSGVLWVHNDSGGESRLYALGTDGTTIASYDLADTRVVDWEDLALGSGPEAGTEYLYVGDIGDNNSKRSSVTIYRIQEPRVDPAAGPEPVTLDGVESLDVTYPDGPHDAEALLSDPVTGDLYLVTKEVDGTATLFRYPAPQVPGTTTTLEAAGYANTNGGVDTLGGVTAGDVTADGSLVALRTYTSAFAWRRRAGTSLADAFAGRPCPLSIAPEEQGEAFGFTANASAYITVSEGEHSPIWEVPLNSG